MWTTIHRGRHPRLGLTGCSVGTVPKAMYDRSSHCCQDTRYVRSQHATNSSISWARILAMCLTMKLQRWQRYSAGVHSAIRMRRYSAQRYIANTQ